MNESDAERVLREKVQGILSKPLQETPLTRMSGRAGVGPQQDKSLLNIANFRLIYDFSPTQAFRQNMDKYLKPDLKDKVGGSGAITVRLVNNNTTYIVDNFKGCSLWIKKTSIEIRYHPIKERWHYVEHGEKGREQVLAIYRDCNFKCMEILKAFINEYGGTSRIRLLNMVHDGKIQGNEITNRIPVDMKFNSRRAKKVYKEQNIELHSPQDVVQFIENLCIKDVVPSICQSIEELQNTMFYLHPFKVLKIFTRSPHEVLINPEYLKLMGLLTEQERTELWGYWLNCVVDGVVCGATGRRLE